MYPRQVYELSKGCIAFFILLSVIALFCMITHFKVLLAMIRSCCGRRKLSEEENMETSEQDTNPHASVKKSPPTEKQPYPMEKMSSDGQENKPAYTTPPRTADHGLSDTPSAHTATMEYVNEAFVERV
ncbi:uncharacterized protein LOC119586700 [Penaeus monodon]|uniref:uncharacterized protein LOC119586700 n=1 Tax=Penaeus monodon TaxID=6687 RepID=UPI0018A70CE7|nr:uncharacterized protein LOC119586700 [Penaeus monodon]